MDTTTTTALPPRVGHVLRLAEIIKKVHGSEITVDALALAILAHPGFSGCHDAPAALPEADQAEGPSLADVDELCAEFSFIVADGDSIEILQEMIAAAITRWRTHGSVAQPVAKPVDVANLMRLVEGVDPLAPGGPEPDVDHILKLAEIIRKVDGRHDLGAAALAEAILAHPGFSDCHDGPAALPAPATPPPLPPGYVDPEHQGEDRKLLEAFYGAYRQPEGGTTDETVLRSIRAVLALRPTVAAVRAADAAISDEAIKAEFRAWWRAKVHPLTAPAYHTITTHLEWGRHLLSRGKP